MGKYKTTGKQTLFDAENSAQKLYEIGNPLEKLDSVIDFEMFRSRLEASKKCNFAARIRECPVNIRAE